MSDRKLRHWLGVEGKYMDYCREERNFAAILYHLLLDKDGLRRFLDLIRFEGEVDVEEVGIYFEYAHLRDLWAKAALVGDVAERNKRYRDAIISMLGFPDIALPEDCHGFNEFFIGPGSPLASKSFIQMPGRWNDGRFPVWHAEGPPGFAQQACRLKWAFNAKPDLVLHLGDNRAICIEAKLESSTSSYRVKGRPAGSEACGMGQLELQEFVLEDLLGYDTTFLVVSRKSEPEPASGKWRYYSWQEVFAELRPVRRAAEGESGMVAAFARLAQPA